MDGWMDGSERGEGKTQTRSFSKLKSIEELLKLIPPGVFTE